MKKSSLLTLCTAGAVVLTSTATFALWDTLSAEKDYTMTLAKAHTVSIDSDTLVFDKTLGEDTTKTVVAPITVTAENAKDLTFTSKDESLAGITVEFVESADGSGEALAGGKDDAPTASDKYFVRVTLPDNADAAVYAGKDFTFKVTATITK